MIVTIDADAFADAGLDFIDGDPAATFTLPPDNEADPPRVVKVVSDGTSLHFFPQRSSGQKRVLARLGFAVE